MFLDKIDIYHQEIRQKYDNLDDDETLAQYFKEILEMRDKLEKEEKEDNINN